ncbi:Alpha/Beta hydrolase protein [Lasiosphaeris hirsuta]|uniref:Alpha/Beta hydrolase protein n=1 Tax=Lasiosphaeris hirsuta TaxID=260670 RepID=A0AA40A2M6_9PEZI|nr:Alpha/Beta hydrolase protein [Lasiosphaeris hirsuta]
MVRPLVGIGHSFGANTIVNLALLHPRLLSSLVLLDPVLSRFEKRGPTYGLAPAKGSAYRRDLWPSRDAATAAFARNKFYSTWDPRVLAAWNAHGLRATPTALHPTAPPGQVTLTTSKHMEAFTYYRPLAQARDPATGARVVDKSVLRDADAVVRNGDPAVFAFYRPEGSSAVERLPSLRPGALWIFGEHSDVNPPEVRQEKMDLTGVGTGGSGGAAAGRVREVTIAGFGHLVPMEATAVCAEHAAEFIAADLEVWRAEQAEFEAWARRPDREKQVLDDDWWRWLGPVKRGPKL